MSVYLIFVELVCTQVKDVEPDWLMLSSSFSKYLESSLLGRQIYGEMK